MTDRRRWWAAVGAVVCLVLSTLTASTAVASATQESCRPEVDMFSNARYDDEFVSVTSNDCDLPIRGVFYSVDSQLVPAGPYGAPPQSTSWSCGAAVTAPGARSTIQKKFGHLTTRAMGYQVRGTNGLWHAEGYQFLARGVSIGSGDGPWTHDDCIGNGTQGQAESWPPPHAPRPSG